VTTSARSERSAGGDRCLWLAGGCYTTQDTAISRRRRHADVGFFFRAQIETNLFGTIIVTKAVFRTFAKESRSFCSVFVDGRQDRPPGRGPYSAAKWGVEVSQKCCRAKWPPLGIKVTIVEPVASARISRQSTKLSEGNPDYDSDC